MSLSISIHVDPPTAEHPGLDVGPIPADREFINRTASMITYTQDATSGRFLPWNQYTLYSCKQ